MKTIEQEHVDRLYATFQRTPFVSQPCPRCQCPVFLVKDIEGVTQTLQNTLAVFVQVRDSDEGEQAVMAVSGYVNHAPLCRPRLQETTE